MSYDTKVESKNMDLPHLYPVVMAGGSGTRFWPWSRKHHPKQFLSIGTSSPLLVETFLRLQGLSSWSHSYVVAGRTHQDQIQKLCPQLPSHQLLIEPCARNTAPCVGLAALHVLIRDPEGIMLVLPSDHHISKVDDFHRVLHLAYQGAQENRIMTLGMQPTRPETGYGYIHTLHKGAVNQERIPVECFVEKPPLEVAQAYLDDGRYVWNSGMFMFKAQVMLDAIQTHIPSLYQGLMKLKTFLDQKDQEGYLKSLDAFFPQFPSVSLDVGIMEKVKHIEVIFSDLGWNDVGHWDALADFMPSDQQGNIQCGNALLENIESSHNIVATELPVVLIGMDHCVVVQTDDALLICSRDHVQHVKKGVERLKKRGREDLI